MSDLPLRRIRFVFTIVSAARDLPDHPLAQKVWLDETIDKLHKVFDDPVRIGCVAVLEDAGESC